jgi:hypothetical protein
MTRISRGTVVSWTLRGVAIATAVQVLLLIVGRVLARRYDGGDETSADIRRVLVQNGVELRPTNPALSRVRMDAVMGGGLVDLTALAPVPHGIDVTVRALMGGAAVRVPAGWRAWWSFRGLMGGVGASSEIERVSDPRAADVRVHAVAVMGGVGLETPTH